MSAGVSAGSVSANDCSWGTSERETVKDVSEGIDYIREHTEITDVLLTGGDPLTLETSRLESILRQLREIDHVDYHPYRQQDAGL